MKKFYLLFLSTITIKSYKKIIINKNIKKNYINYIIEINCIIK